MSKKNRNSYGDKHPGASVIDDAIDAAIDDVSTAGTLTCRAAEQLAHQLGCAMEKIGETADLRETKIVACQLGLFGQPQKVQPATEWSGELEQAIKAALAPDGKLTCTIAWAIAADLKVPRLQVSRVCEAVGAKISRCQLGAF